MTTLFADRFTVHRGMQDAVYPDNHFATVTEETIDGFRVEVCTAEGLPERCRASFGEIDFEAIDELERPGSDISVETVIAELAAD